MNKASKYRRLSAFFAQQAKREHLAATTKLNQARDTQQARDVLFNNVLKEREYIQHHPDYQNFFGQFSKAILAQDAQLAAQKRLIYQELAVIQKRLRAAWQESKKQEKISERYAQQNALNRRKQEEGTLSELLQRAHTMHNK